MADSFVDHSVLIPGPSFHINLAPLDALHPVHYSRRLLIFHCSSTAQRDAQLSALKAGLQALILRCPILGGTISPIPGTEVKPGLEDWRTIIPGPGLELVVRDLRGKIAAFKELEAEDFPPLKLPYGTLIPVPRDLGNDQPFPACKVQLSAIEGGTILTWAMSHSVADGSGNNELFRLLSEETRLAQEKSSELTSARQSEQHIGEDRSVLRNITSEKVFKIEDHPAFRLKTISLPQSSEPKSPPQLPRTTSPIHEQGPKNPLPFEATAPEVPVLLHISAPSLAQLKRDATTSGEPPISTHDAICALIWRSTLLIRSRRSRLQQHVSIPDSSNIFLPSDARRHLHLPASYMGNAVYQLTANIDLNTLLASPDGLKHAAGALRSAITAVHPELVASYMARLREGWIDWGFMHMTPADVAMGTDWGSGGIYEDDWGEAFGRVVRFRYPGEVGDGGCVVLPKLPDGSAEVVVSVMPSELELLMEDYFAKYLKGR